MREEDKINSIILLLNNINRRMDAIERNQEAILSRLSSADIAVEKLAKKDKLAKARQKGREYASKLKQSKERN